MITTINKDGSGNFIVSFSIYVHKLLGSTSSKAIEIYNHVSTKSLGKIKGPLDSLDIKKGVICNRTLLSRKNFGHQPEECIRTCFGYK